MWSYWWSKVLPREILWNLFNLGCKNMGVVSFRQFSNFVRVFIYLKWIDSVKIKFGSECLHCFLLLSIYSVLTFLNKNKVYIHWHNYMTITWNKFHVMWKWILEFWRLQTIDFNVFMTLQTYFFFKRIKVIKTIITIDNRHNKNSNVICNMNITFAIKA